MLVLGELDAGLDLDRRLQQGGAQRGDGPRKPAFQVVELHEGAGPGIGLDQVVDRLGLQQVQLAVAEGAVGEFAGQGRPGAAGADQPDHLLDDEQVGVQRYFGHVLAAVGTRGLEDDRQAFIDALGGVMEEAVVAVPGLQLFGQRPEDFPDDAFALAPGNANHGDAGPPRRRGQGYDRILIHSAFCGW